MEGTTLVLMGRSGNGKSSTGNSILGRNAFTSGRSFKSVTKECKLERSSWKDGRILNVVDTPGLFDTNASKEFLQKEIVKCIDLAKNGVHGVLYVVSVRNRFTEEEAAVLDSLQMLFGSNIVKYMVVVFTGGDELENDGLTLQDYLNDCPQQLQEVLHRCDMRMVLFNNKTTLESKKEKQRTELMKQIDNIITENGGQPYSSELFHEAQVSSKKLLSQQGHTHSGRAFSKEEMEKANAEQLRRLNDMVEEKMQTAIKILQERLASEKYARKQVEETALLAQQISDEEIRRLRKATEKSNSKTCWRRGKPTTKVRIISLLSCPVL